MTRLERAEKSNEVGKLRDAERLREARSFKEMEKSASHNAYKVSKSPSFPGKNKSTAKVAENGPDSLTSRYASIGNGTSGGDTGNLYGKDGTSGRSQDKTRHDRSDRSVTGIDGHHVGKGQRSHPRTNDDDDSSEIDGPPTKRVKESRSDKVDKPKRAEEPRQAQRFKEIAKPGLKSGSGKTAKDRPPGRPRGDSYRPSHRVAKNPRPSIQSERNDFGPRAPARRSENDDARYSQDHDRTATASTRAFARNKTENSSGAGRSLRSRNSTDGYDGTGRSDLARGGRTSGLLNERGGFGGLRRSKRLGGSDSGSEGEGSAGARPAKRRKEF